MFYCAVLYYRARRGRRKIFFRRQFPSSFAPVFDRKCSRKMSLTCQSVLGTRKSFRICVVSRIFSGFLSDTNPPNTLFPAPSLPLLTVGAFFFPFLSLHIHPSPLEQRECFPFTCVEREGPFLSLPASCLSGLGGGTFGRACAWLGPTVEIYEKEERPSSPPSRQLVILINGPDISSSGGFPDSVFASVHSYTHVCGPRFILEYLLEIDHPHLLPRRIAA